MGGNASSKQHTYARSRMQRLKLPIQYINMYCIVKGLTGNTNRGRTRYNSGKSLKKLQTRVFDAADLSRVYHQLTVFR